MVLVATFLYVSICLQSHFMYGTGIIINHQSFHLVSFVFNTFEDFYGHRWFHWFWASFPILSAVIFFFRFVELSTLTYSACLCHYVIAYHLSSFASNHWSVTWKNVDKPFFYSLSHVCHSVYYFTSVIISCSMHVFKVKIDLFHRALSHFGVLQI